MFTKARLKLTTWYLLIIMTISLSFSMVIYKVLTFELDRFTRLQRVRIERRFQTGEFFPDPQFQGAPPPLHIMDPELIEETKHRLILMLILVNGAVLVISGGLGFFLAGKTLKPIKNMVEEQNQFISDASHEIKTPLTSLKSAFEVYLRNKARTRKEADDVIKESISEVNKLQSLSESLLCLTSYEKPNNYSHFEKLSLVAVGKEALRKISPLAKQKKVSLENNLKETQIYGSKFGLVDLFVILLDNAVKFSKIGGKITITSQKTDGSVLISVTDHGIGIDEKDLPNIFDRFYQADAARTKQGFGGYGLGLSIAKKIAEVHHGSISVKSKVGVGSTFTISLPVKPQKSII